MPTKYARTFTSVLRIVSIAMFIAMPATTMATDGHCAQVDHGTGDNSSAKVDEAQAPTTDTVAVKPNGAVIVKCVATPPGKQATVTYCDESRLIESCRTLVKGSEEASTLEQIADVAKERVEPATVEHTSWNSPNAYSSITTWRGGDTLSSDELLSGMLQKYGINDQPQTDPTYGSPLDPQTNLAALNKIAFGDLTNSGVKAELAPIAAARADAIRNIEDFKQNVSNAVPPIKQEFDTNVPGRVDTDPPRLLGESYSGFLTRIGAPESTNVEDRRGEWFGWAPTSLPSGKDIRASVQSYLEALATSYRDSLRRFSEWRRM